jgi:hypothetical protein
MEMNVCADENTRALPEAVSGGATRTYSLDYASSGLGSS